MRTMYDSVNASAIPRSAAMVAGYVDGLYAWSAADWALFPNAVKVRIAVFASTNNGDVLDVEPGNATAAETEGWIRMRKAAGLYRPTIYCSLNTVPSVRQGTGPYVLGRDYDLWVADYDGSTASVYSGSAAKQYENTANYDVSAVYDGGWPHRTATTAKTLGPVRQLHIGNIGPHSVRLSWLSPSPPVPGIGVKRYQVTIRHGGKDVASYPRDVAKGPNPESWTGGSLAPGTAYVAMVRAIGSDGKASPWADVSFTTTTS